MRKLVLKSFKGRKREMRISIVMLALIYMCGIMTILFEESFYRSLESMRRAAYGEWTGAVFGAGEGAEQILSEQESANQIGRIVMLGNAQYGEEPLGVMGAVDETAQSLGRLQTAEGRLPADSTEIALSETAVSRMAGQVKVGGKVEIAPAENGEVKSFVLSGIVKPWGREWETAGYELPSVILGMDETVQGETYLFFQNDSPDEMSRIQARMEILGEGMYVYNEKAYPLDVSAVDEFFQDGKFVFYIVLIAAILIGYLMMLTLKSRRYSLTVLRGMGADAGEVIQLVLWESAFLWGMAFLAGVVLSALGAGAALYAVHRVVKIPVHLEIQEKYILEYIACVTVIYFVCNLAVALTAIGSQIRTAFKLDSGLLDRSVPPRLKKAERLTFFTCLRRKGLFYSKIYASRFVISVLVMVVSAVCLRLFIEEKKEYEYLMGAIEHAYDYQADDPAEGLTDGQIRELEKIDGVKSVEKECFINSSTMIQDIMFQEIRICAPVFKNSGYVGAYRRYNQKYLGVPVDEEGDYFSIWELRGLGAQDEKQLSFYETAEDSLFDGTQYLFILTAAWLVYMLMMYHGNQVYLKNEGKRIGVLRALGMDRMMLKSRYLLENLTEGGAIILVSSAVVTGKFLMRLRTYGAYDSIHMFFKILADNPEDVRLFLLALLMAVTAFLGVSAVTLYMPLKKLSGGNIAENLELKNNW